VRDRITAEVERPGLDAWRVIAGPGFGDCEDYALSWREALVAAGLPRGALDIAVAETEQGEIHAVLAIHTDLGTLIFDNRQSGPKPWTALPYAWLAIEPVSASITPWQALPDHQRIGATPPLTAEGEARD
jgi:predicted transglutaminase-like cysteine proteinase